MIDLSKHSEEEAEFLTYIGGRLSEMRRSKHISQKQMAKHLKTTNSSIHDLEYGYRWISAWDLKAYADICGADIGSIFEGVSDSISHSIHPDFVKLSEEEKDAVNNMISMLAAKRL